MACEGRIIRKSLHLFSECVGIAVLKKKAVDSVFYVLSHTSKVGCDDRDATL